jgi:hypothetical protein
VNTPKTPAQLLRNWHEQRPSNKGDLDSSLTGGGWENLLHGGGPAASDFIFVPYAIVVECCC